VRGAFEKVLETRERLAKLLRRYPNFELGINSVFCSENQQQMPELIRFVKKLEGIRTHTVSLIRGDAAEDRLKEVESHAYDGAIRLLESNLKDATSPVYGFAGARLKAAQDILQRRFIRDTVREKRRLIPCYAGKLTLVLTESGELYPCEAFNLKMGNVRSFGCDVRKLLESTEAQKAVDAVQQSGCHCTHECYMMMNILFNPRLYPQLLKEYLQILFPRI
jgi:radical SAM protein with 4Fe4S-binding SPASM domain